MRDPLEHQTAQCQIVPRRRCAQYTRASMFDVVEINWQKEEKKRKEEERWRRVQSYATLLLQHREGMTLAESKETIKGGTTVSSRRNDVVSRGGH